MRRGHRGRLTAAALALLVAAGLSIVFASSADAALVPSTGAGDYSPTAPTEQGADGSADTVCPAGSVLTGAAVRSKHSPDTNHVDYPYRVVAQCTALRATLTGGQIVVTADGAVTDGTTLQACAESVCGQPTLFGGPVDSAAACPAGQVVTGLRLVSGWWVDDFIFGCQAIDASGAPTGPVSWTNRAGGDHNPADPGTPVYCPGDLAVGLQGQVGDSWIHNPRLECAPVLVPQFVTSGFLAPVTNAPAINTGRAGRTYPVKFEVSDPDGTAETSVDVVRSIRYVATSCAAFTTDRTGAVEASATGRTSLRHDSGQYVYNWASPSPGCYTLFVTLADGSALTAFFHLT